MTNVEYELNDANCFIRNLRRENLDLLTEVEDSDSNIKELNRTRIMLNRCIKGLEEDVEDLKEVVDNQQEDIDDKDNKILAQQDELNELRDEVVLFRSNDEYFEDLLIEEQKKNEKFLHVMEEAHYCFKMGKMKEASDMLDQVILQELYPCL